MRKITIIVRAIFASSATTRAAIFLVASFLLISSTKSQSKLDSIFNKLDPQKFAAVISKKAEKLEDKLVAKSMKVLDKLQSQEEKLYSKMLATKDSLQAKAALADIKTKYKTLQDRLKNPALSSAARHFIPHLDSLTTALKFLDQSGVVGNISNALSKTKSLQDKFQQAEEIKKFIKGRKEQLKTQLEKLGMVKQLKKISKSYYYYAATISEYKNILKNPKRIEKKALELLSKTKIWKEFFRKNSMLASLFRIPNPDEPVNLASFAGLQTRVQLNNQIQQQIGASGANAQAQFQQNLQAAQTQLQQLKDKIAKFGGGSSDDVMPEGFRKNDMKTKTFLQRLEFGANIQSQKATNFFPAHADLGLSAGYRLSQNKIVGIGLAYSVGLGRGWNQIRFTQEGIQLRSYADLRLKKSFWISAGYETNYKASFRDLDQLRNYSAWSRSCLVGLSKVIDVKSKFFKKTKFQLLLDLLSYQQIPRTQPIIFRLGYNLK